MNTLRYQRQRLTDEIIAARVRIRVIQENVLLDSKTLLHLNETIARNTQLISMIDYHLACDRRSSSRSA